MDIQNTKAEREFIAFLEAQLRENENRVEAR